MPDTIKNNQIRIRSVSGDTPTREAALVPLVGEKYAAASRQ
jgi:hypothetical protein